MQDPTKTPRSAPSGSDQRDELLRATTRWKRTRTGVTLAFIVLFVLAAFVLSLSDGAPARIEVVASDSRNVAEAIEDRVGVDFVDRSDIPYSTLELLHLGGWASGTVLFGLSLGRRYGAGELAIALFGASVGIEVLQQATTSIRRFELADVGVNATGILLGLGVVLTILRLRPGPGIGPCLSCGRGTRHASRARPC